jgi:hypothetical protein
MSCVRKRASCGFFKGMHDALEQNVCCKCYAVALHFTTQFFFRIIRVQHLKLCHHVFVLSLTLSKAIN